MNILPIQELLLHPLCRPVFHHHKTSYQLRNILQQRLFSQLGSAVCRRRVFELGSGSIKCQISDVDVQTKTILKTIATKNATVLFTRDLKIEEEQAAAAGNMGSMTPRMMGQPPSASSYSFSPTIQQEGIRAIQKMLLETDIYRPEKTIGVATEAFRKAANGPQFANRISSECNNLPVIIVSAKQEAKLGFQTAAAMISEVVESSKLISWDCGAGSFQISSACYGSHVDSHGSGTITALAQQLLRQRGMSPTEVANHLLDILSHQLAPVPASLKDAIQNLNCQVVAIGSQHSIFNQQRILSSGGRAVFTQQDVERSIRHTTSLGDPTLLAELELRQSQMWGDEEDQDQQRCIENATFMIPKLILLLAIMRHVGIPQATFYKTNGNCAALLVQPWLWESH